MGDYRSESEKQREVEMLAARKKLRSQNYAVAKDTYLREVARADRAEEQLRGAVEDGERLRSLGVALQRDRREPDKVLAYALEVERIGHRLAGGR